VALVSICEKVCQRSCFDAARCDADCATDLLGATESLQLDYP
jgi:hypothetical protein